MNALRFRRIVWAHYKKHGRHDLPWRKTRNSFKILVSEVMLQQTQVERVMPLYKTFIKKFPTAKKLAAASFHEVLKAWQGLGYNRRAKMLHSAAKEIILKYGDTFPAVYSELVELPSVGPYTARAVVAFAYNQDVILIETNIRTAIIHHFFAHKKKVSDTEIERVLAELLPKGKSLLRQGYEGQAREWYSALMDYGAHLKRSGISHNTKNKAYARQSKFAGSLREARGAILRAHTQGITSRAKLLNLLGPLRRAQARAALRALVAEGLINANRQ